MARIRKPAAMEFTCVESGIVGTIHPHHPWRIGCPMNVQALFPSKFVAASDLMGQDVNVVICRVQQEPVGADEEIRPTIYLEGYQKGMVLNRTNAKRIAGLYGQDTDNWIGRPVTLYPSETE